MYIWVFLKLVVPLMIGFPLVPSNTNQREVHQLRALHMGLGVEPPAICQNYWGESFCFVVLPQWPRGKKGAKGTPFLLVALK